MTEDWDVQTDRRVGDADAARLDSTAELDAETRDGSVRANHPALSDEVARRARIATSGGAR